jgi:hypothetical protein
MIVRNPIQGVTHPAPSDAISEYLYIKTAFAPGDVLLDAAGKETELKGVRVYLDDKGIRMQWTDSFASRFMEEDLIKTTVKIHRKIPLNNE